MHKHCNSLCTLLRLSCQNDLSEVVRVKPLDPDPDTDPDTDLDTDPDPSRDLYRDRSMDRDLSDLSDLSYMSDMSDMSGKGSTSTIVSNEEMCARVLSEPKFGMFSMFQYTCTHAQHAQQGGALYCSKFFTPMCALPLVVFCAQWMMFAAIILFQHDHYALGVCPQQASMSSKLLMCAISMIYFVNSFFLWDDLVNRTSKRKVIPSLSAVVMLDSFQEFLFSLVVYVTNIVIVFTTESPIDMLFNCLALEFVMSLDNEFERMYFKFNPAAACDIYENSFVHSCDNKRMIQEKMQASTSYCLCRYLTWLPFKILTVCFMCLPVFCGFMIFYGPLCK
jgi:hypothetical protein